MASPQVTSPGKIFLSMGEFHQPFWKFSVGYWHTTIAPAETPSRLYWILLRRKVLLMPSFYKIEQDKISLWWIRCSQSCLWWEFQLGLVHCDMACKFEWPVNHHPAQLKRYRWWFRNMAFQLKPEEYQCFLQGFAYNRWIDGATTGFWKSSQTSLNDQPPGGTFQVSRKPTSKLTKIPLLDKKSWTSWYDVGRHPWNTTFQSFHHPQIVIGMDLVRQPSESINIAKARNHVPSNRYFREFQ